MLINVNAEKSYYPEQGLTYENNCSTIKEIVARTGHRDLL